VVYERDFGACAQRLEVEYLFGNILTIYECSIQLHKRGGLTVCLCAFRFACVELVVSLQRCTLERHLAIANDQVEAMSRVHRMGWQAG
jgi:hypothetical protein